MWRANERREAAKGSGGGGSGGSGSLDENPNKMSGSFHPRHHLSETFRVSHPPIFSWSFLLPPSTALLPGDRRDGCGRFAVSRRR